MTQSVPVIAAAMGDTGKAMTPATSLGCAGRAIGMVPSDFMTFCLPPSLFRAGLLREALRISTVSMVWTSLFRYVEQLEISRRAGRPR